MQVQAVDTGRALRFAGDMIRLKAAYCMQPKSWNRDGVALVRIVMDGPLRDNLKTRRSLRTFAGRAGFELAGATLPTVRLFRSTLENLAIAAASFSHKPLARNGQAFINKYVGLQYTADIGHEVGRESGELQICYHQSDEIQAWPGIEAMLNDLGGREARCYIGVKGCCSVWIEHAKAIEIAEHPLVLRIDVAPMICYG
jgi:hypothetical protein